MNLERLREVIWVPLLAVALSFGWFFLDGNVGINFADEGYLWYGALALKAGQIPIRDFQAYDPGRYVWVAAWSWLFGDGLVSVRAACVIFQCLGVTCGLLAARRVSRDWRFLTIVAVTLVLWMVPRFKVFEQSIALMAIYASVRLIELPTLRQHFATGVFVGLAAFMGRNHGLYLTAAFGLVMLAEARGQWARLPRRMLAIGSGVALGYLPQGLMFAFEPGYLDAFLALLRRNVTLGSNLAMDVPWPWRIPAEYRGPYWRNAFAEGCLFLALPLVLAASCARLFWVKRCALNPLFLAATAVALPYAHHTFSRADSIHLAHSGPALVLVLLAWAGTHPSLAALAMCVATAFATIRHAPLFEERVDAPGTYVSVQVRGQTMRVARESAAILATAATVADELAGPDEPALFLPHWPGLYAATGRCSPLRQIYFIRPASQTEEERTIAEMEAAGVTWVMLQDYRLDGRDELRFRRTHPRMFDYFTARFEQVAVPGAPADTTIFRRR